MVNKLCVIHYDLGLVKSIPLFYKSISKNKVLLSLFPADNFKFILQDIRIFLNTFAQIADTQKFQN